MMLHKGSLQFDDLQVGKRYAIWAVQRHSGEGCKFVAKYVDTVGIFWRFSVVFDSRERVRKVFGELHEGRYVMLTGNEIRNVLIT